MNRISFAFLVSLLIHSLFALSIWAVYENFKKEKTKPKPKEKRLKVSLKKIKKQVKPKIKQALSKPIAKTQKFKRLPQKKFIKPTLNKTVPKKKEKIPTKPLIKTEGKKTIKKAPKKKEKSLFDILSQDMSIVEKKIQKPNLNSENIQALYGDMFTQLSDNQQRYIVDNQEIMRKITQEVLYRVATINLSTNMSINAQNIVEFYLHPNGDISDFKFLSKSGHYLLEKTTKETIEYSYSKYPRPKEKTLIRYNVVYSLAPY